MKVVNSRFAVQDAGHFEEDLDCGWLRGACETLFFVFFVGSLPRVLLALTTLLCASQNDLIFKVWSG